MIEYPPQTSLPLITLEWKFLLVGKRIESNTKWPASYQTMRLVRRLTSLSTLTSWFIKNCHSFRSRMLSLQTHISFLRSRIRSRFCLDFHPTRRQKKELRRRLLPPYHCYCSFKYGYSFTRLKRTHYIGMELQKKKFEHEYNMKSP